jgi:hypothetical protein
MPIALFELKTKSAGYITLLSQHINNLSFRTFQMELFSVCPKIEIVDIVKLLNPPPFYVDRFYPQEHWIILIKQFLANTIVV